MDTKLYIFPYNDVRKGSDIILYGAGGVGRSYYNQLQYNKYCKIKCWVDRDEKKREKNSRLEGSKAILGYKYDMIIIAIEDEFIAKSAIMDLIQLDIDRAKIVYKVAESESSFEYMRHNNFIKKLLIRRINEFIEEEQEMEVLYNDIHILINDYLKVKFTGNYESREWFVSNDKRIAYLNNAKVACTSIKISVLEEREFENHLMANDELYKRVVYNNLDEKQKAYFKFTFVRNPYIRLLSCYINKYKSERQILGHSDEELYFGYGLRHYLIGYLCQDKGFDNFVEEICKIPAGWDDKHFCSQYALLYEKDEAVVDYIGKFEELPSSFDYIRNSFSLPLLEHYNKTSKRQWQQYYNERTAKLVYEKYRKDFVAFGYEEEYIKLMDYIKSNRNPRILN